MKKLMLMFSMLLFAAGLMSQTVATLTPDTAGTIAGVATTGRTHYFYSPQITGGYSAFTIEIYVTTSGTHATDSTRVQIFGSMDGVNYFKLTDLGTPYLNGTAKYRASETTAYKLSSEGTGAVGWVWPIETPIAYRYIRVGITQYKDLSVLTVNRAKLHLWK